VKLNRKMLKSILRMKGIKVLRRVSRYSRIGSLISLRKREPINLRKKATISLLKSKSRVLRFRLKSQMSLIRNRIAGRQTDRKKWPNMKKK